MGRLRWLLGLVVVAALAIGAWALLRPPEPVLYRGGTVLSLDRSGRVAEALAVEDGLIAAVGSEAELAEWAAQRDARVVDLKGGALLPGFIDAHGHFPGAGLYAVVADLNSPPIGDIRDLSGLIARLEEQASATAAGDWVVGMGYDDTLLAEGRHPTREDLDRASSDHPVVVIHVSGHLASVNSEALARLGIHRDTPDPEGGLIRRDPGSGEPDGVLEENAMEDLAQRVLQPRPLDAWRILRRASQLYVAAGVTTAQNGYATAAHLTGLAWMTRLGLLPLRVVVWPEPNLAAELLDGEREFSSPDSLRLRVGAVKLVADGSIQGYTGYLSRPYHVPPGDDPEYRGYPRIEREDLIRQVRRYHEAGWQVAVHGNGDAAIDDILDAFQAAQDSRPRVDARHVVIHAQMARDDQLDRMQRLGVIPSFFSLHTYYWGDRHRDLFMGPERAARMSPARSALDRELPFTIHADTPIVPMEPLRLVWAAVNRRSTSGAPIGPDQRIGVVDALRAVTLDAARQHFEEELKGSLEPGKLADLVILDRSPLDDPETLDRIRVLETIVGGETVYAAPGWRPDGS